MTNWLDFKTIKRAVTMESLLRQYRVELRRCGKDQYRGRCPIHGGQGPEAFHVNLARNIFHCFSCEAGGTVLDFVAAMEKCSLRDAAGKLSRLAPPVNSVPANNKKLVTEKRSGPVPLRFRLRDIDSAHPYLASRGVANRTALDFGIGFYPGPGLLSRRLVIPIHDFQGHLIAYCGRSLDGTRPRYRFPPRFAKSRALFNYHRAAATSNRTVVIVEGFFDCLKVHQAGIHSVVALMGVALYEAPRRAIAGRFTQVMLMLDGDPAGQAASRTIADSLRTSCSVDLVSLPAGVQPDQLSEELIRNLLGTALPDPSSAR